MRHLCIVVALWSQLALPCGKPGEPSNCGNEAVEVSTRTERMANEFEGQIRAGELRERTNLALNAMVRFAVFKLRAKGKKLEARRLENEWDSQWNGYLLRRDLGDHKPLSNWLAEKYAILEFIFGEQFMQFTRLVDLKIINFGIPVVFACVDNVDEAEFYLHFVPLTKVTIYWTSFFTCVGGTWGTGFLFCSPIAWGCEYITGRWIAPKLNPFVFKLSCH